MPCPCKQCTPFCTSCTRWSQFLNTQKCTYCGDLVINHDKFRACVPPCAGCGKAKNEHPNGRYCTPTCFECGKPASKHRNRKFCLWKEDRPIACVHKLKETYKCTSCGVVTCLACNGWRDESCTTCTLCKNGKLVITSLPWHTAYSGPDNADFYPKYFTLDS